MTDTHRFCVECKLTIQDVLGRLKAPGLVLEWIISPSVITFKFNPGHGVKMADLRKVSEELAREIQVETVRVLNIPGEQQMLIEVPRPDRQIVWFNDLMQSEAYVKTDAILPMALGRDTRDKVVIRDLVELPHLLMAGTTGSGKSAALNALIVGLLNRHTPKTLNFLMIDPKIVELRPYRVLPHLIAPIICEKTREDGSLQLLTETASHALHKLRDIMMERYGVLEEHGLRNIQEYHALGKVMGYIICVIDEVSQIMIPVSSREKKHTDSCRTAIMKLSEMGRAAGIHLILSTQRPTTDIINGTIKANMPTRISLQLSSHIDSKTILDQTGAETLTGSGDVFLAEEKFLTRIQAPYITTDQLYEFLSKRYGTRPKFEDEVEVRSEPANKPDVSAKRRLKRYVYVFSNPSLEDYKIGATNDVAARLSDLSSRTSIPTPFKCEFYIDVRDVDHFEDAQDLEKFLHKCFDHFRSQKEFFKVDLEILKKSFEKIGKLKTTV